MGRPRRFKDNDILDRALQVFWAAGFEATTIEDLEDATDLRRASLYGAFGDKESLFRACLARYGRHIARPWLDDLAGRQGPKGV
ncbi:MAG: helix-turn-helix transcriptional regulator, partial [Alphaproteobacteria bacterium]|nr:helix-turn-helix transcriptional regulator [Alphaproteobacteria bacterium]